MINVQVMAAKFAFSEKRISMNAARAHLRLNRPSQWSGKCKPKFKRWLLLSLHESDTPTQHLGIDPNQRDLRSTKTRGDQP
jgi:hypothetical protein